MKKIVKRLTEVLTKKEFLELQELMDGDANHALCELISKEACKMAPELFTGLFATPKRRRKSGSPGDSEATAGF